MPQWSSILIEQLSGERSQVNDIQSWLGVIQSRKMMALLMLGFLSGLPFFLTSKTLQLWMQDANISLETITLFGLVSLPYSLKFLWSPLLDRFSPPVLGLRRGWLLLTQAGLTLTIAALASQNPTQDPAILQALAVTCIALAFLSATQDIAGDAYRTDILEPAELEIGASIWVWGYRAALFVTSSLALVLADIIPWNIIYWLLAGLMGLGLGATLWAPKTRRETQLKTSSPLSSQDIVILVLIVALVAGLLGAVITAQLSLPIFYGILVILLVSWVSIALLVPPQPALEADAEQLPQSLRDAVILPLQEFLYRYRPVQGILILTFILLYKLGDALVGVTGNLFLRELGFSKSEIGVLQGGMGFIATTVGLLVGGVILTKAGINRCLWLFGILQLVSNLGYYALSLVGKNDTVLVLAINIENFCAGLVTVVMVAFQMSLCSHIYTTTQFALFSSLMAISRDVLSAPSGKLAEAIGWSPFFLVTVVAALPGLLLLPLVAPWTVVSSEPSHPSPSESSD
jgi:MFS transporter, PAT family, beta-lactamase induction signal transducer AmpG